MNTLRTLSLCLAFAVGSACAAAPAYDEAADAHAQVQAGLATARQAGVPLLVVFGANWCPDCRALDLAFKNGAAASLVRAHFQVVKVDVGRFDRNVDLAQAYGVPLKKGIPAVAVLSPEGRVVYTTKSGELADARDMGEQGIYDFFTRVSAATR